MGFFFNYLINFFEANLAYEQSYKAVYLIGIVVNWFNFLSSNCNFVQSF